MHGYYIGLFYDMAKSEGSVIKPTGAFVMHSNMYLNADTMVKI